MIERELENYQDKFTITEKLTVFIGSWNVGGGDIHNQNLNLKEWLNPSKYQADLVSSPDMYIIGLQEIVELNANYLLLSSNEPIVNFWKNSLKKSLEEIDKYILIKCLDLVGLFLIFFVKQHLKDRFKSFDYQIIKTGLLGTMGNKGSCLIRFSYLDSTFAVSCGHFAAGGSHNSSRLNEMKEILDKHFDHNKSLRFRDHNIWFMFGDLNFRTDLDFNTCLSLIKSGNIRELRAFDQFNKSREVECSKFTDLEEGELFFNPTYKYAKQSNEYDTKKKRVPSWCDRIFFKKSKYVSQLAYDRAEFTYSDHRPIFGIFHVFAFKELNEEKEKLIKEIHKNLIFGINLSRSTTFKYEDSQMKINYESIEENENCAETPTEEKKKI